MENQPMASKPSPAEQTHTLADERAIAADAMADEVADEVLAQQTPDVTPASTPAVVQPTQIQPLADEAADAGHAPLGPVHHQLRNQSSLWRMQGALKQSQKRPYQLVCVS